ncbi:tyrosine-type recombinase/integrase [Sulfurospirillum deleyianum]|uniref:Tyrosine recombinase XerH n=1 Tax=Sulfurospirillum deleyianum (strain ATCC 51133 / DSM 6946 / 5175) TaxID=525898 RepID=D1B2G9_SULD5|nr:tyrosine-type recombinase/integrase [Sulfurospirillum deleyianum]ACZ12289.1 integrase family protein [Sulfurospirillum deleyianum DSM 6946]
MRYKVDEKESFEQSLLFWLNRFIKSKLTSLSNRHVVENAKLSKIIGTLNQGCTSMQALKDLSKEARNIGLIGINLFINPLEKFYTYVVPLQLHSLKEIDEELLSEFLASQTGSLSDATKKNYRIALLSFFKFLDKQNEDEKGTTYQFRIELKNWGGLGGRRGEKLPAHMYKEEITRFLKAIEETEFKPYAQAKNRLLIKMILYTGMRVSEALGLKIKDMVKEENYLICHIRGKGNKPRTAMIKYETIEADLQEWMEYRSSDSALLFQSRTGKPLTQAYVSYVMDKMLFHAGIRKEKNGAHMLRHTFATLLYQKNRDLILVQEALGHADLNTSRIYTHFDKERLKIAADTLDGM